MIIQKIALVFGIIFLVFAGLAALITYQTDKLLYTSAAPTSFIQLGILTSMLPFFAYAAVSFAAAGIIWRIRKSTAKKETEKLPKTQTLLEAPTT